jgi:hypothetical protein
LVGGPGSGSRGPNRFVKGGRFVPKRLVSGGRTTGALSSAFVTSAAMKVARIVILIFTLSYQHGTCPRVFCRRA